MRRKANSSARFYVSKASGLEDMTREELADALLADEGLLPYSVQPPPDALSLSSTVLSTGKEGWRSTHLSLLLLPSTAVYGSSRDKGDQSQVVVVLAGPEPRDPQPPYDLTRGVGVYRQDA
ncbi:hypothetical protein DL95DRAFT_416517 [Leptodontidium sp. 2 PMI_412]|nr:hypothetical protein DL95DRAFT_416517 [Leptodontidium sp. 2 PMI_412]